MSESPFVWVYSLGEGSVTIHDCGEDSCCCLEPAEGVCPTCHGSGGWTCPYWNVQA